MGEYAVVVASLATEQIYEAVSNVRDELSMPKSAEQLLDELSSAIEGLSRMPSRFRTVYEDPGGHRTVRRRNVRKYTILYFVNENEGIVNVFAVLYGSPSDRRLARLVNDALRRQ